MKRGVRIGAVIAVVAGVGVTAGLAHQGATGIVKQRMEAMKSVAAATKAIATLDWSDVRSAQAKAAKNARIVSGHAADVVKLFPKGSDKAPSEAAPAIWKRPDVFAKLANDMGRAANTIAIWSRKSASQKGIARPFAEMTATCKACHAEFRIKR